MVKTITYFRPNLEEQIELMIRSFYHILHEAPEIHGDFAQDNEPDRFYRDIVTLIFNDGNKRELSQTGSAYDWTAMTRTHWDAAPTKNQIEAIIKEVGKEPIAVEYRQENDWTEKQPIFELTLQFPWEYVKEELEKQKRELAKKEDTFREEDMLLVPCQIAGIEFKLFYSLPK